jgi:5-methylcytosine-specific restriction endonuclease McrBC regulatory subunit McrC
MILKGLGIEDLFMSNQTPSFAFLLDMNHLFEQFLHRYLSEVLSKSKLSLLISGMTAPLFGMFFEIVPIPR